MGGRNEERWGFILLENSVKVSCKGVGELKHFIRWFTYLVGVSIFSLGITITITVQHLGLHPWDVLNVALYNKFGLTIGSWQIIFSFFLIVISWFLDKRYVKIGTFLNAILVGLFVDFYMWLGFLPNPSYTWTDVITILIGIIIMGFGGGLYNSADVGAGPRDGFMLSIADKLHAPIGRVRIITESIVLVFGLLLRGPVHVISFIFTFIQSPIFQFSYEQFRKIVLQLEARYEKKKVAS